MSEPAVHADGAGSRRISSWAFAVAVAVVVLAVFAPTLRNEFVNFDDAGVLSDNPHWRGLGSEQLGWMFTTNHYGHYQPVTWLTYGLDYVLWGEEANADGRPNYERGVHLTNNLFHAANAVLVYFISLILLRCVFVTTRQWRDGVLPAAAALAALMFGVHPLRVESVAWATERRDVVSAFFLLLTVLFYLKGVGATDGDGVRRWRWMGASLAIYIVSMLSKVGGAPLPIVLVVIDAYPLRRFGGPAWWRSAETRRILIEKLPFLVVALGFAVSTIVQQTDRWLIPYEVHGFDARLAQSQFALVFYAWKTICPIDLLPLYELRFPLEPLAPQFVLAAMIVVTVGVAAWVLRRRVPGLAAAVLVYGAMLGPLLGFFQNGPQLVADRYTYLSTHGFVLLLVGGLVARVVRPAEDVRRGWVFAVFGVALLVPMSVLTVQQCGVWRDSMTLWRHVVSGDDDASWALNNVGYLLFDEDRFVEALPYLERAAANGPANRQAHVNLWKTYEKLGRERELVDACLAATEEGSVEVAAEAWYRLGNRALDARRNEEALEAYDRSIALEAGEAFVHTNRGVTLIRLGRWTDAETSLRRAIELDPELFNAHLSLGDALLRRRDTEGARAAWERARTLRPDHEGVQRRLSEL